LSIVAKEVVMRGFSLFIIAILGVVLVSLESHPAGGAEITSLPRPGLKGDVSVEEALAKRRSIRSFSAEKLTIEEISQLLWSAQGITQKGSGFRTAPSAGALYPLEVYLVTEDGLFHYIPQGHRLERLADTDLRDELAGAALGQRPVREAAADIVVTAVYSRTTRKYGQRGVRYAHIEVGHLGQNVHLQAVALGLGSVSVGAFSDEAVRKVLSLPEEEMPLYIIPVGHPR
jgi:SagB-type dehydrogenase family enzyme